MGTVTASCGHQVASMQECVAVEYDDADINFDGPEPGFEPVVVSAAYCVKCAVDGVKAGYLRYVEGDD